MGKKRENNNYKKRNKAKHDLKVKGVSTTLNQAGGAISKGLFGINLNFFGFLGKKFRKYDETSGYINARNKTYHLMKSKPNKNAEELSEYHYKERIKDDVRKGIFKGKMIFGKKKKS